MGVFAELIGPKESFIMLFSSSLFSIKSLLTVPGDKKVEPTEGKSFLGFCLVEIIV
jgi:hypothetical protein